MSKSRSNPVALEAPELTLASVVGGLAEATQKEGAAEANLKAYMVKGAGFGAPDKFLDAGIVDAFVKQWDAQILVEIKRLGGKGDEKSLGFKFYKKSNTYKGRAFGYVGSALVDLGHTPAEMPSVIGKAAAKVVAEKAAKKTKGAKAATRSPEEITLEELKAAYEGLIKRIEKDEDGKHPALEKAKVGLVVSLRALGWNVAA